MDSRITLFWLMIQLYHQIIFFGLERIFQIHYRMTFADKIKTLNDKIKANKAQYSLDREAAKMSALTFGKFW